MNQENLVKRLKEFGVSHKKKVEKAIKEKKLYAYCINGHKHYINSFEEYIIAMDEESILYVYGL